MKNIWLIQAETNLHVGNESSITAGLIDKMVQRDVLTTIPCINASSLKGAMSEYATYETNLTADDRIAIFGSDKKNENKETAKGQCSFFDAQLMLLPVQDDYSLYRLVTSKEVIENFLAFAKAVGVKMEKEEFLDQLKSVDSKHFVCDEKKFEPVKAFKEHCDDDELPIIARNNLQGNGNLWYEQVVPRKAVFATVIDSDDWIGGKLDNFNGTIIQIGANATIGQGYCRFHKLENKK